MIIARATGGGGGAVAGRPPRLAGLTSIEHHASVLRAITGSNTLHVESAPGKGDFRPMDLRAGEGLRFNGIACRHYTCANDTGRTRVSFDFRVIPRSLWRNDWEGRIGDYRVESVGMANAEAT